MNGVINFLKPPGMSSGGAVVFLRHLLKEKTGHAGTLDPGACGVLPICVGKATRISSFLMGGKKEYIAEITFGALTDTGDSYGKITEKSDSAPPTSVQVAESLNQFSGRITQLTPAYSAAKQNGVKRYELARRGAELQPKPREIEIFETEYLGQTSLISHRVRIVCGKGTYIRTLCEDIGKILGQTAYMSFLARTRCAGLGIEAAYTADELQEAGVLEKALLPADSFLDMLPRIDAAPEQRRRLICGAPVDCVGTSSELARIYVQEEFLGLGSACDGVMKISTLMVDE